MKLIIQKLCNMNFMNNKMGKAVLLKNKAYSNEKRLYKKLL